MANVIKNIIQSTSAYHQFNDWRWRERLVHCGNAYPDKTFYVIRRHASRAGLFSFAMTNLAAIVEASDKGYVPVVDMQNSINPMIDANEVGSVNGWDRFFRQPCGYTLDDIAHAQNVILGSINPPAQYPDYEMLSDPTALKRWRDACHQYLRVNDGIRLAANAYIQQELGHARTLGVLCRGTDYTRQRPHQHPVQPDIEQVIDECRKAIQSGGYERIYLATEDMGFWEAMNTAFPEMICSYQTHRYVTTAGQNINDLGNAGWNAADRNREYLTSIVILSQCNALVAGAAGGTYGALLMSDGYEYQHVFQLGLYD